MCLEIHVDRFNHGFERQCSWNDKAKITKPIDEELTARQDE